MSYYLQGDYYRGDYYRGDPGLFSFIGGALKTVAKGALGFATGGPIGAAMAVTSSLIPRAGPVLQAAAEAGGNAIVPGAGTLARRVGAYGGGPVFAAPPGGGGGGGLPAVAGGTYGGDLALKLGRRGFHLNKSTYFSRRAGGLVPKGTTLVRNRRMNPGNGRALHRAARRIHAGVKMFKRIFSVAHGRPLKGRPFPKRRRKR